MGRPVGLKLRIKNCEFTRCLLLLGASRNIFLMKFIIVTVFSALTLACGSSSEPAANRATNVNTNAIVVASPGPANDSLAPNLNVAIAQANANRRKPGEDPTAGPRPTPQFRQSGESSQTAVTMDDQGRFVEVRVFEGHPQFERIEAVWVGLPEKELRYRLRGGRTITKRTKQLENLQSATTAQLLEIAGLPAQ
jgi:hypothetical protein